MAVYFDASPELVVNTPDQPVVASRFRLDGASVLRLGGQEQPVLAERGDDLRIDWGYLYLAADRPEGVSEFTGDRAMARTASTPPAGCPSPTTSPRAPSLPTLSGLDALPRRRSAAT